MAEFESLATDEALDTHIRRHAFDRLIMLSDGIFAIATTLAALEIHLPEHSRSFVDLWAASSRSLTAYGITFLVIAVFWIGNRDIFARLHIVDRVMTILTLSMLCVVAIIPACAHALFIEGDTTAAFVFYALIMTTCGLLNMAMWAYASYRPGLMRTEVPMIYRAERVAISATMPLMFGTLAIINSVAALKLLVPFLVILVLIRRLVIPRWFQRHPQKSDA
jgi:uncharacterized membrane protein